MYTDFETCVKYNNKFACKQLYKNYVHTVSWACKEGLLDVVKYLVEEHGETPNPFSIDCAAAQGHAHIVKYLIQYGIKPNQATYHLASKNGHMNVLQELNVLHF